MEQQMVNGSDPGSQGSGISSGSSTESGSGDEWRRRKPRTPVDQVSALLRGEDPGGSSEADARDGDEDEGAEDRLEGVLDGRERSEASESGEEPEEAPRPRRKPASLQDAAEQLGMSAKELYDLEIGLGDGSKVTLGAMKDAYADLGETRRETVRREVSLDEREGAIRDAETQLSELWELAGDGLSPATKGQIGAALKARREAAMVRAGDALARSMPEIRDEAFAGKFEQYLLKAGQRYGFHPAELVGMADHRVFLVMADLMKAQARIDKLVSVKPDPKEAPRSAGPQGRGGGGDSAFARAKRTGKPADVTRAVSKLIGG